MTPFEIPALTLAGFEQRLLRLMLPGIDALDAASAPDAPDWQRVAAVVRNVEAFAELATNADADVVRAWRIDELPRIEHVSTIRDALTDTLVLARALRGATADRDAARLRGHLTAFRGVVDDVAPAGNLDALPDTDVTTAIGDDIANAALGRVMRPLDLVSMCLHEWRRHTFDTKDYRDAIEIIASRLMDLWAITGAARPMIEMSSTTMRRELLGAITQGERITRRAIWSLPGADPARAVADPASNSITDLEASLAALTADYTSHFRAGRHRMVTTSIAASKVTYDRHVAQVPLGWRSAKRQAPHHVPSWTAAGGREWPVVAATQTWLADVAGQTVAAASAVAFQQLRDRPWPPQGPDAWQSVREAARHAATVAEAGHSAVSMSRIRFDRDFDWDDESDLSHVMTMRMLAADAALRTAGDINAEGLPSRFDAWDRVAAPHVEAVLPTGRRLRRSSNEFIGRTVVMLADIIGDDPDITQRSDVAYPSVKPERGRENAVRSVADDDLARVPWADTADRLTLACDVLRALSSMAHRLSKNEAAQFSGILTAFDAIRIRHLGMIPPPGDIVTVAAAARRASDLSRDACTNVLAPYKRYEDYAHGYGWEPRRRRRSVAPVAPLGG